jgi:diguanylate cyclase (GGDEF)-like protein
MGGVTALRSATVACWLAVVSQCCLPVPMKLTLLGVRPLLCAVTSVAAITAVAGALRWTGRQRVGWLLLAGGISGYAVGFLISFYDHHNHRHGLWGLNLSDCFSLLLYPLGYLGLFVLALCRHRQRDLAALLEAAVIAAGAGAVAIVVAGHLYPSLLVGPALTVVYDLAYAVGGFTLLVGAVSAVAVSGWRIERSWLWLVGGLLLMTVGDAEYGLMAAAHQFRLGTWSEVLYTAGPVGVALAATSRPAQLQQRAADPRPAMVITALATLTAIGTLVSADFTHVPTAAVLLAGGCASLAVLRTGLYFQQGRLLEQSRALARTDELTGLPNRRALGELLRSTTRGEVPYAVLLLDVDGFKDINDTFGHAAGDELLVTVADRLRTAAWPATVTRLGGDEFAVLKPGTAESAVQLAGALCARVNQPIVVQGVHLVIGASVGIGASTEHPGDQLEEPEEALRRADVALYQAKTSRCGVQVWEASFDARSQENIRLVAELRIALDSSDQLVAFFQPQADGQDGRIVGFEALVRWQHPRRGLLNPGDFLSSAEGAGLLPALTQTMVHQSLAALQLLAIRHPGLTVAVNVGAGDLLDADLPEKLGNLLARYNVRADRLIIEVTEDVVLTNPELMIAVLDRLRDLGVRIALDDYGTGLSSLSYLRELPLDILKIDKSLVTDLDTNPSTALIVASTIQLAHGLKLRVVVEGVESSPVATLLATMGCDEIQGWLLGRPVPVNVIEQFLTRRTTVPDSLTEPAR